MALTVVASPNELKSKVGLDLGNSDWVEVTQERIDNFAKATDDAQWIHTDPVRAAEESPFKGTIAHGYLTMSLAPNLLSQLLRVENSSMAINYGIDKMRLSAPVPSGSRVRMSAKIKHVRDTAGGAARTTLAIRIEVEGSAKAACSADLVLVYFP